MTLPYNPINITTRRIITTETTKTPSEKKEFKPKKAGTKTAHVIFILDESSSMRPHINSTISGFNEFLDAQKQNDVETFASLYKFDGAEVKTVFSNVDIQSVEDLTTETYTPRGSTNLWDAVGETMETVNDQLKKQKKKDRSQVTMIILTDGEENCSKFFTASRVKAMVEAAEGKEWSFMFLGANIDAFAVGSKLGFRQENTLQYGMQSMDATFKASSRMASDMSSMKSRGFTSSQAYADATFTDDERKNAS